MTQTPLRTFVLIHRTCRRIAFKVVQEHMPTAHDDISVDNILMPDGTFPPRGGAMLCGSCNGPLLLSEICPANLFESDEIVQVH